MLVEGAAGVAHHVHAVFGEVFGCCSVGAVVLVFGEDVEGDVDAVDCGGGVGCFGDAVAGEAYVKAAVWRSVEGEGVYYCAVAVDWVVDSAEGVVGVAAAD